MLTRIAIIAAVLAGCSPGDTVFQAPLPPPVVPAPPPDPCMDAGDMQRCEADRLGQLADLQALIDAITSRADDAGAP